MGDALKLTRSETVTIETSTPDALVVEAEYGPSGRPPPAHLHPEQDEHFEVLDGELRAKVDGLEQTLRPGDRLDIPRATKHQMWNASAATTRVRWTTSPAGRTEQWFRAIDGLVRENDGKTPGPLAFGALLDEYSDVFRLAVGPQQVTGPAVKALGVLGRLRGGRS